MRNVVAGFRWPPFSCAKSTKPADKEHDKYQHSVTYSGETVIKHVYLNVANEVLTFN